MFWLYFFNSLTMDEDTCANSGLAGKSTVSMPLNVRLMTAMLLSYSKSTMFRTPRKINFAAFCLAKSTLKP